MVGNTPGHPRDGAAIDDVRLCNPHARRNQGRANYSMQFKQYEETPRSVSEEIIAKNNGKDPDKK